MPTLVCVCIMLAFWFLTDSITCPTLHPPLCHNVVRQTKEETDILPVLAEMVGRALPCTSCLMAYVSAVVLVACLQGTSTCYLLLLWACFFPVFPERTAF